MYYEALRFILCSYDLFFPVLRCIYERKPQIPFEVSGAFFLSIFAGKRAAYPEKNSTYECGFEPFDDSRGRFEVKFYLVAILFIIFDLEIIFLFPWAIAFEEIGLFGFLSMMFFLS